MQFIFNNGLYGVAKTTGSQDNLLIVRLSDTQCTTQIVPLLLKGKGTARIDGDAVLRQVSEGLALVNQKLGKQYFLSEIRFVPSDENSPSVYNLLIYELIMRIDSGGEFKSNRKLSIY